MSKCLCLLLFTLLITGCASTVSKIIVSARVQLIKRTYIDNTIGKVYLPNRSGMFRFINVRGGSSVECTFLQRDQQPEFRVKKCGFRNNTSAYFNDYKQLSESIASGKLKYNDLEKIAVLYNNWYDDQLKP